MFGRWWFTYCQARAGALCRVASKFKLAPAHPLGALDVGTAIRWPGRAPKKGPRKTEKDRERRRKTKKHGEARGKAEEDRERRRKTEKDRERPRNKKKYRERLRNTEKGRDREEGNGSVTFR